MEIELVNKSNVEEQVESSSVRSATVDLAGDISEVDVRECFTGHTAKSIEVVEDVYGLHANAIGFCFRRATSRKNNNDVIYERYLTCSCYAKPDTTTPPTPLQIIDGTKALPKRKRNALYITKTECKAAIRIKLIDGVATVKHHVVVHNHPLNRPEWLQFVRSERRITPAVARIIIGMEAGGLRPSDGYNYLIRDAGGEEAIGHQMRDQIITLEKALAAKPANHRDTRSSKMMKQSGSSTMRIPLGNNDASTYEVPPEVPPKNKLPNNGMISPNFQYQTENQDISVDEEVDSSHGLVSVGRYKVKQEVAPLLERIFTKYGDIAKDCNLHSPASLTFFLDSVFDVFQTLQRSSFREITSDELLRMLNVIGDLENVKFNVGWLHKKVSEILEMKELFNGYPALKEEKTKIDEEEKKLEARKKKF